MSNSLAEKQAAVEDIFRDVNRIKSIVTDAVEEGVETALRAVKQGRDAAEDAVHDARVAIKRNPLQSAGILIGVWHSSRRARSLSLPRGATEIFSSCGDRLQAFGLMGCAGLPVGCAGGDVEASGRVGSVWGDSRRVWGIKSTKFDDGFEVDLLIANELRGEIYPPGV